MGLIDRFLCLSKKMMILFSCWIPSLYVFFDVRINYIMVCWEGLIQISSMLFYEDIIMHYNPKSINLYNINFCYGTDQKGKQALSYILSIMLAFFNKGLRHTFHRQNIIWQAHNGRSIVYGLFKVRIIFCLMTFSLIFLLLFIRNMVGSVQLNR